MRKIALIAGIMSLASICSITAEGSEDAAGAGNSVDDPNPNAANPAGEAPAIDPDFVESEDEITAPEDAPEDDDDAVDEDSPVTGVESEADEA